MASRSSTAAGFSGLLALLSSACAPGSGDAGYLLLDPAARREGYSVEAAGERWTGAMPLEIEPSAPATLLGHGRRARIEVGPGELVHVRGKGARVDRGEPDRDRLRLRAAEEPALRLAAQLGAQAVYEGDGRWLLQGREVLAVAALVGEPEGIAAVEPVYNVPTDNDGTQGETEGRLDEALSFDADGDPALIEAADDELARAPSPERLRIERELSLELSLGPGAQQVFEVGESIPLAAKITNRAWAERWVVPPGDGSEMGWREPYLFYTAAREVSPGKWEEVPEASFSRCGNFDDRWDTELVALPPGASLPLAPWFPSVEQRLDLAEPGRVQIRLHYRYRAGRGEQRSFKAVPRVPEALRGVPPFELVSTPVEVVIVRPLALTLTQKAPLQLRPETRLDALVGLSLSNRSGRAMELSLAPTFGDEGAQIDFQVEGPMSAWPYAWYHVGGSFPKRQPLGQEEVVELTPKAEASGSEGTATKGAQRARIRAWMRMVDEKGRRHELRSNWISATVERSVTPADR